MPLYEYECTKCGHRFEVIQKFSDPPKKSCPKCGSPLRKLLSAPAIQFKGSGWYVTDYGGKGKKGGSDTGKESTGGSSISSSPKEGSGGESAGKDKPSPPGGKKKD